jgi:GrpB-like predicted nucleotidyltransferase (UPF0157 family)
MRGSKGGWPSPSAIVTFEDGDPAENPWVTENPDAEKIEITDYSPEWPRDFETSKAKITSALRGIALNIEHIGSTEVPMLASKPVIDIDLIVADPTREEDYVPSLTALGYVLTIRERTWYQHRMLRYDRPRINLHVFGPNCPKHARHVLFRDWLREHPEDRVQYAHAKNEARNGVSANGLSSFVPRRLFVAESSLP